MSAEKSRLLRPPPLVRSIGRSTGSSVNGQSARVVWLTGLPGAGKSTLAEALDGLLHHRGLHSYVLDGDKLRTGLSKDLGFTPADRAENVRRVAEVARLMMDAGLIVIVALVSPFRHERDAARTLIGDKNFIEVWVNTPLAVCMERDPKGLYARARAGVLQNMTGVGQPYEEPRKPDLIVTGTGPVEEALCTLIAIAI